MRVRWGSVNTSTTKGGDVLKFLSKKGVVQVPLSSLLLIFTCAIILSFGLIVAQAPAGVAMTGYHVVHARNPVHAYTGPGPTFAYVQDVPAGSELDIACQATGASVHGTTVWNKLVSGNWISNYYASTESVTGFSPYLRRCPSISPNREAIALSRAVALLSHVYQDNGRYWANYCDHFIGVVFGMANSGYNTATDHFHAMQSRGMVHYDTNPPKGAMMFYGTDSGAGHVAFALGNGYVITTPSYDGGAIYITSVLHFANPRGWSYAQPSWDYWG